MKRLFILGATLVGCAAAIALFPACNDTASTTSPAGETGSVSGTVTFTGTWPTTPPGGGIQVSIYSSLMPPGVPGGPPDAFTNPLNKTTDFPTYNFKLSGIDPGDYAAVFVGWRDPSNPSGAKLIGTYWVYVDSLGVAANGLPKPPGPSTVTVEKGKDTGGLDIVADLDLSGP